jgi:hypothetical protein
MKLKATPTSQSLPEHLWDALADSQITLTAHDECPLPWDASFEVQGETIVVSGGAGPSGFGDCVVKVPRDSFNLCYDVELTYPENLPHGAVEELQTLGWEVVL